MPVPTSKRMLLMEQQPLVQEIYIGKSLLFSEIRRNMCLLISEIFQPDGDDYQNEPALLLRFELQKWLTSPLTPDSNIFERCGLTDGRIRFKWGSRVEQLVKLLKCLFASYSAENSILNVEFTRRFVDIYCEYPDGQLKIWCHKKDRSLFRELLNGEVVLDDGVFISTLAEYRKISPFDALFRFGPFRTSGIANAPEALITSPLYHRLIRFVWEGLSDEEGFADDPILPTQNYFDIYNTRRTVVSDNVMTQPTTDIESVLQDELKAFDKRALPAKALQKCVLVEFPEEYAVLMRPGTNLLVFNPKLSDEEAIGYRTAADIDADDYLVKHDSNVDFGEISIDASQAPLAAVWKRALADFWNQYPTKCIQKVKQAGIEIQDVDRALNSWSAMSGSVIRAPRSKKHFEALITKVLDQSLIPECEVNGITVLGWRRAWAEIESSRVNAIQHGTVEHAIVNQQLVTELGKSLTVLRQNISSYAAYHHKLLPGSGLAGHAMIKPVIGLSSNIFAPVEKFGKIVKLPLLEQYCVGKGVLNGTNDPEIY